MVENQPKVEITREQQRELDPFLDEVAYGGAAALDRIMAVYRLGRGHGNAAEIEVTMGFTLRGPLATVEAAAELAAQLDEWMAARYPQAYEGPAIRLDVTPATPVITARVGGSTLDIEATGGP